GTLTIGADGSYSYILNDAAIQGMDDLETADDVFTYTVSDGAAPVTTTLTVTVFGNNDAPVANADTNWAQEDVSDASGNVLTSTDHSTDAPDSGSYGDVADTDVDVESLTVTNIADGDENKAVAANTTSADGTVVTGLYGTLTIGADGSYSYILNDAAIQGMDDLETADDVFTYTVSDG
uniref:VCBS domain-containing protein n=1 Tax=uncultured Neptuniibacter sp. TaxID=502143 RepID=UPI00262A8193